MARPATWYYRFPRLTFYIYYVLKAIVGRKNGRQTGVELLNFSCGKGLKGREYPFRTPKKRIKRLKYCFA